MVIFQDNCPRCGWELERGLKMEDAQDHLDNCNNAKEIAAYKKKMAEKKSMTEKKKVQEELQEDIQVYIYSDYCLLKEFDLTQTDVYNF